MTRSLTALVLGIISPLAVGMAAADTITWGGGTGDFLTDANWIDGVAPVLDGTDDALITAGTVTYTPGGDVGWGWNGSNLTISGGVLEQTTTHWWRFNGSGTFTVNGGSVTTNASNVQFGDTGIDTASFLLTSGSFNHVGSGEFKVRGGNSATITGGTLTSRFFGVGDFAPSTIDVSGGTVNLIDGSISFNGIYTEADSYINVTDTGVFHVGNVSVSDAIAFYLDTDKVRAGGDTNNALLQVASDGNGGVNISVVPEPGSLALLGIGALCMTRRRR